MNVIFLISALAMPPAFVPADGGRQYDISVFRNMVGTYHRLHPPARPFRANVYLFGGDDDLLLGLRSSMVRAWRVTIDPHTPFDIVAFPDAVPLARESGLVVIYLLEADGDPWNSMRLFSEATGPLAQGGVIAFFDVMAPRFKTLAKARGYWRLPFTWYEMELWEKPRLQSSA